MSSFVPPIGGRTQPDQFAWISTADGEILWRIYKQYASVRACSNVLTQQIFCQPIRNNSDVPQASLEVLARNILADAMVVGISVVCVKHNLPPKHLPWGSYQLGVARYGAQRTYVVLNPKNMRKIPNAYVLSGFDASPSFDGMLNSIMNAVRHKTLTIARLSDCLLTAERQRCCPATLIEQDSDNNAPRAECSYDFFADADADDVEHTQYNSYKVDTCTLKRVDALEEGFQDPMERGAATLNKAEHAVQGANDDAMRVANREQVMKSIAPIPYGYRVSRSIPVSQPPTTIVDIFMFFEQEVYSLFGVPRSYVHQDHTRARVDEGAMLRQLLNHVHSWQRKLERALCTVVGLATTVAWPKRRKPQQKDVLALYEKTQNMISFEFMPICSAEALYNAHVNGVISFEDMQQLQLAKLGLPASMRDTKAKPLLREQMHKLKTGALADSSRSDMEASEEKGSD